VWGALDVASNQLAALLAKKGAEWQSQGMAAEQPSALSAELTRYTLKYNCSNGV